MLVTTMLAAATAFDPEAATQAYLATIDAATRAKSDAYAQGSYWLPLWSAVIAILTDLALLYFGWSARFRNWAERVTRRRTLQSMLYALPYVVVTALAVLPWAIYAGFARERQYGLMNQSFGGWAGDLLTATVVNIVVSALLFALVFAVIRASPRRWWLWGAAALTGFLAIGVAIAPVFITPLFNTYTELRAGPVRGRIVAMARAYDVPADHIYVFDQSRQTKTVNANVSGLGPTIRISLNDNLLNRTTLPQTASVMGHELGHYVLGHLWRLIAAYAVIFLAGLWVISRVAPALIARWRSRWGVRDVTDVAAVPVFSILATIFGLLLTPIVNTVIRTNEIEADAFGLDAAREPDGFAQIALTLAESRKLEPGPVEEFLFYDHPSPAARIRMSMVWKARHLAR